MTTPPPYPNAPQPYAYAPASPPRATGGLLALGIIGIIYSGLFRLCCGSISLVGFLSMALMSSGVFEGLAGMSELEGMPEMGMLFSPQMQAFNLISGFILLLLGFGMLAGSIGLIRLKLWGRTLSLAVAGGEIAWAIMSFGINLFFIYPSMNQAMGEEFSGGSQMIGSVIGGVMGTVMALAFPVTILIVLNVKSIKDQFGFAADMRQSY